MSGDEISTRLLQAFHQYLDAWRHQAGAAPHAPAVAGSPHAGRFFFDRGEAAAIAGAWLSHAPEEAAGTVARAERVMLGQYPLLGFDALDFGRPVDWQLDPVHGKRSPMIPFRQIPYLSLDVVGDHKIVWELSRHQHLVTLVRAWLFTGERRFAVEALAQWDDWQSRNPYPLGIHWTSTLEVAFRVLSWIWMDWMLSGSEFDTPSRRERFAKAAAHGAWYIRRYLSTYFAPNTHLLGEAYVMWVVGTAYPEYRDAALWRSEGWRVVNEEAVNQVRADGFHFEQSTYYHVYALDFFLQARCLAARTGLDTGVLDRVVPKMAEGLAALSGGGIAPRFGDDDGGRLFDPARNRTEFMTDPLATTAIVYGDRKLSGGAQLCEEAFWLVGAHAASRLDQLKAAALRSGPRLFRESGYACLPQGDACLVMDVGPHGYGNGGHGHADALSIQLMSRGVALITDPATASYPIEKEDRNRFRGTAAHSTVEVDGLSQADPVGSFKWGRHPVTTIESWSESPGAITASHDGYQRLPDPVTHRRTVAIVGERQWRVEDSLVAAGRHRYSVRWSLPPGAEAAAIDDGFHVTYSDGQRLLAQLAGIGWRLSVQEYSWSPAYGRIERALQLVAEREAEGTVSLTTRLSIS